ncbi:MAG: taurine dioxygenase [Parasphingorhabdus sp.]|jgi:taurine dioxygenase
MNVQPLTPTIGAEICAVDCTEFNGSSISELRELLNKHKVVVLRDQQLTLDGLEKFSALLGPLLRLPYIKSVDDYPDIIRVLKEADEINMGVFGGDWHSDFSFLTEPPSYSILYAEEIPPLGGDTLWVNMTTALEQLPADLRETLTNRRLIHVGAPYGVKHAPEQSTQFNGSIHIDRNNPEADRETLHPAIVKHPDTGEFSLFLNPTYTTGIEGYDARQAREILNRLFQFCTRPEFSFRLRWQSGNIVIWDNRTTMHYAVNDYDGYRRCMYRATISGNKPIAPDID